MKIISREEAEAIGQRWYFTGKPCKFGHVSKRHVKGYCYVCNNLKWHRWYRKDKDKWRKYNGPRAAKHRADKIQRTPPWADLDKIKTVYIEATRISKETGIVHHVDHIVPLMGRKVSGLHVFENLQIIPARDNLSKSNNFIP